MGRGLWAVGFHQGALRCAHPAKQQTRPHGPRKNICVSPQRRSMPLALLGFSLFSLKCSSAHRPAQFRTWQGGWSGTGRLSQEHSEKSTLRSVNLLMSYTTHFRDTWDHHRINWILIGSSLNILIELCIVAIPTIFTHNIHSKLNSKCTQHRFERRGCILVGKWDDMPRSVVRCIGTGSVSSCIKWHKYGHVPILWTNSELFGQDATRSRFPSRKRAKY